MLVACVNVCPATESAFAGRMLSPSGSERGNGIDDESFFPGLPTLLTAVSGRLNKVLVLGALTAQDRADGGEAGGEEEEAGEEGTKAEGEWEVPGWAGWTLGMVASGRCRCGLLFFRHPGSYRPA